MKKGFMVALLLLFCAASSACAGGGATGGATEVTQQANNAELVAQVKKMKEEVDNTLKMVDDMIENSKTLAEKYMGPVAELVSSVMYAYNTTNGLLSRAANLDHEFYSKFYSAASSLRSEWSKNYAVEYYKVSLEMDKKTEETLRGFDVTAQDIKDSSKALEKVMKNADSAEGRNAVLQAGNELLGVIGSELIKTRTLLGEQSKMYLDYFEYERKLKEAGEAAQQDDLKKWKRSEYQAKEFNW